MSCVRTCKYQCQGRFLHILKTLYSKQTNIRQIVCLFSHEIIALVTGLSFFYARPVEAEAKAKHSSNSITRPNCNKVEDLLQTHQCRILLSQSFTTCFKNRPYQYTRVFGGRGGHSQRAYNSLATGNSKNIGDDGHEKPAACCRRLSRKLPVLSGVQMAVRGKWLLVSECRPKQPRRRRN